VSLRRIDDIKNTKKIANNLLKKKNRSGKAAPQFKSKQKSDLRKISLIFLD
jgi:hypothetical protein